MLATYGVDVLDPQVSLRRIWVLLARLPAGAWPDRAHAASWTVEAHLLAGLLDAVQALTYVTVKVAGGKPQKPKPMPRPGPVAASNGHKVGWRELGAALSGGPRG